MFRDLLRSPTWGEVWSEWRGVFGAKPATVRAAAVPPPTREPPAPIPPLDMRHFRGCLDREPHIRLIYDALTARVRTHVLLYGDPAGGKTRLVRGFAALLGPKACWHVDLTTTTQAGLEAGLVERFEGPHPPRVLCLEEVEKCKPAVLGCLVQVMDERGRVERTHYRGQVSVDCPAVVVATCNDMRRLGRRPEGTAILSRFGLRIPVELPDRDLLQAILLAEPGVKPAWVEAVLGMLDVMQCRDARIGKALLSGGDRLLDGSYLEDFRRVNGL